jgi:hypothetical protein
VVELHKPAFFPKGGLDLLASDQLARSSSEQRQQSTGLVLKANATAVLPKLSCVQVQLEGFESETPRPQLREGFHVLEDSTTALSLLQIPHPSNDLAVQILFRRQENKGSGSLFNSRSKARTRFPSSSLSFPR